MPDGQVKLTCDVGGTFTDVVASDQDGRVAIGKSLTTPERLIDGLLDAIAVAGEEFGVSAEALLQRCTLFVYSTTQATNAILERRTARTALLCTKGFPDILTRREGGSMFPYDFRRPTPEPWPRHLTFEIDERVGAEGDVVVALEADGARETLRAVKAAKLRPSPSRSSGRSQIRSTS